MNYANFERRLKAYRDSCSWKYVHYWKLEQSYLKLGEEQLIAYDKGLCTEEGIMVYAAKRLRFFFRWGGY